MRSIAKDYAFPVLLGIAAYSCVLLPLVPAQQAAAERPAFSKQLDRLIQQEAIGPSAVVCSDSDFVRRVYLDLTGVIPTAEQVRVFLSDDSSDKRLHLIDSLLQSPAFARHLALHLNVLFLERRSDKHVDQSPWELYLIDSILQRKPLDQWLGELIHPESQPEDTSVAAKFLLNREAESHALTREVGRLMFGMDLQCAQCHDHPLVSDYQQADYFGLHAFLHRTKPFQDPKTKKSVLAEAATGETQFTSVFTGDGQPHVVPRLPWGHQIWDEPEVTEEEGYSVKPDKQNAGRPHHSRRQVLAAQLNSSIPFRRNLANRLWQFCFGEGLVHPVDYYTRDNPPAHPALLHYLADQLVEFDFDLHAFIRGVLLSQAYQRAIDLPQPAALNVVEIELRQAAFLQQVQDSQKQLKAAEAGLKQAQSGWDGALQTNQEVRSKREPIVAAMVELQSDVSAAATAHQEAMKEVAELTKRHKAYTTTTAATKVAASEFAEEAALAEALAVLQKRLTTLDEHLGQANKKQTRLHQQRLAKQEELAKRQAELGELDGRLVPDTDLRQLEERRLVAFWRANDARELLAWNERQERFCQQLLEYHDLRDSDPVAAELLWEEIVQQWTSRLQLARLKPLSPEQLTAAMMQAMGMLAGNESAAAAAIEKSPPAALQRDDLDEAQRARIHQAALQQQWVQQIRGLLNQFVAWYGGLPGEEFQATVNQALFLGNSPTVTGWLDKFVSTFPDPPQDLAADQAIPDTISLAILSRPATAEEQLQWRELVNALESDGEDPAEAKKLAISQWAWALLSSAEFRFNH